MQGVLANLTASYEEQPRSVVVVYQQMTEEPSRTRTRNLELLDDVSFLTGRTLARPRGIIDRRMLKPFTVRVFESPEVVQSGA